jgi:GTP-binding protein
MEYIQQDECIEVTPQNIRLRKIMLEEEDRKKFQKMMKSDA